MKKLILWIKYTFFWDRKMRDAWDLMVGKPIIYKGEKRISHKKFYIDPAL